MNDWIARRSGLFFKILDFMMLREEDDFDYTDEYDESNDCKDVVESFLIILMCMGASIAVIIFMLKLAHVM